MDPRNDTRFEDSDFADAEWLRPEETATAGRTGKYVAWTLFLLVLVAFAW